MIERCVSSVSECIKSQGQRRKSLESCKVMDIEAMFYSTLGKKSNLKKKLNICLKIIGIKE